GVESSLGTQAFGVVVTIIYSGAMTAIILGIVQLTLGLRVTPEQEREGLDLELHGEHIV
ncbi:MAG: ammonium transporter, partial [Burkholderiales bacterium]|nr:ammonium transporter [Burkholderiales bacterium]